MTPGGRGRQGIPIESNWRGFDPIRIRAVAFWYPFKEPADNERLAAGLRKAKVPE
jgi:hypothetical protein